MYFESNKRQPNDDEEQNRMDLVHHIYSLVMQGKLHTAPISDNPQRVLDLGTGTGIWAIDFAEWAMTPASSKWRQITHSINSDHPSSEVIGTDLSPIQPDWYVEFSTALQAEADNPSLGLLPIVSSKLMILRIHGYTRGLSTTSTHASWKVASPMRISFSSAHSKTSAVVDTWKCKVRGHTLCRMMSQSRKP